MKVCIGGTFDILHKGHKILIDKAFKTVGKKGFVFIGVATEELIKKKKDVRPFSERKRNLTKYIKRMNYSSNFTIEPIKTIYGPTLEYDFDAIIVSSETVKNADKINEKNKKIKKEPMKIIKIPYILAEDGKPISTTRIKKGEIDSEGNMKIRD